MATKVPKTTEERLTNLDDQLFLLNHNLRHMSEDIAFVKALAAGLRLLICSYGRPGKTGYKEGFLWRLADELKVSDILNLQVIGNVDLTHPIARGLMFLIPPLARAGQGDPRIAARDCSFKSLIENFEAVYISGKGLTHCTLIKLLANQIGLAHEDDEIDQELHDLNQVLLNGVHPFIPILALDAELTIEIGERTLEEAEKQLQYQRKQRTLSL